MRLDARMRRVVEDDQKSRDDAVVELLLDLRSEVRRQLTDGVACGVADARMLVLKEGRRKKS